MKFNKPRAGKRSVLHGFYAMKYSYAGLKRLMYETAFRHEVFLAVFVFTGLVLLGVSAERLVITLMLMIITLATEAMNTAIEEVVDFVSPQWSQAAKDAKDLGSVAVTFMLFATGIYVGFVIWTEVL